MKYELGRRIAAARKANGMTQDELAHHMNVSRQSVSHWEKGLATPSFDALCKLVPFLQLDITDLLGITNQAN